MAITSLPETFAFVPRMSDLGQTFKTFRCLLSEAGPGSKTVQERGALARQSASSAWMPA